MKAHFDADVLLYEVGYGCETGWGGNDPPPFDYAADLLNNKINNICAITQSDNKPILFLTGKSNFRNSIAKTFAYKDRNGEKPFHYYNLKAYIQATYDCVIKEGLEADDLLRLYQTDDTITCTRDKDGRNYPGWKYSWEVNNQPSWGPILVDEFGYLKYDDNSKKLEGCGGIFFYAQCIMGDSVDTIPGLPRFGKKKAFEHLKDCKSLEECYNTVLELYTKKYNEFASEHLLEQARCLHMIEKMEDDKILLWNPPNTNYEDWYNLNTGVIERVFPI